MIVVDASAAVHALLNDGDARHLLATERVAVPHLADSEIAHALRSQVLRGRIAAAAGGRCIDRWARLGVRRYATVGLLGRVWDLRQNLTAYDAAYVALAEALGCSLATADARLASVTGPACPLLVVRS